MSRFTLRIFLFSFLIAVFTASPGIGQENDKPGDNPDNVENYREQIRRLIGFLEFSLNTLGGAEANTSEKEVIINESYLKAFLDDKVQVEDDLDENREILTYKDVQAYLKDVDFFFKEAAFTIDVQDIQSLTSDQGMSYFKVTANRNLQAVTLDDLPINNNQVRYIEINLDDKEKVLKIASIYTTKINEGEELMAWWNGMPSLWKILLGSGYQVKDSIRLDQVDFLNDTTFLFVHEVAEIVSRETFVHIGTDSLLVIETDTVIKETYDTIPAGKNNSVRLLKDITRIENLDISGHAYFTDLYPVDQMTDLKSLDISGTLIEDLFTARNLTKLTSLNVSGTRIKDLFPIQYNSRIRELYLDSTEIRSLAPIKGFHDLEILHLNHTLVDSLQPIGFLDKLKDLRLDYTPVIDITPLSNLTSIENLSISGNKVDSLSALQYLSTMKRLYFEGTGISNLAPLSLLVNLQLIDADRTQIADLEPLGNLPALEKVYCDQTPVTRVMANAFMASHPNVLIIYESQELTSWWEGLDLSWQNIFRGYVSLDPLPTTEQLHQLTLLNRIDIKGHDDITSLEPLSKLTNLKEIDASGTLISDIAPLAELNDLKILNCADTRVNALTPLLDLLKLESLDFSNTQAESLSGLEKLSQLIVLNIDGTGVNDLKPLYACSELETIYCDNTKVGKVDIDDFLDRYPGCLVIYQTDMLKSWWNGLAPAWTKAFRTHTQLDDPPAREQLHTLAALTSLDLTGNREITSLQPAATLNRLEELNLSNGSVTDLTPVSKLIRLKKLNLSGNPVENLSAISLLPVLTQLDISNTAVSDLESIQTLTKLEQLNFSGTQVKKLDPVASLTSLVKLECYNTEINNLKPLTGLVKLKQLVCYNTKLNEKKVAAFKETMPGVEVVFY